jgi:hypothetical protein
MKMGCDSYYLDGIDTPIKFSEMNDDVCCLCTFPHNDNNELTNYRIRSLAMLGAAVVLLQHGVIDNGFLPNCLPKWIVDAIGESLPVSS